MPGYVIHLATANRYIEKHPNDIKNKNEFIKGVIEPDLTTKEGKQKTHYGKDSSQVSLRRYLEENDIKTDFDKGYFLHLITDYIFYNRFLPYFSKEIYNDYDKINRQLIEKYNVILPDEIINTVFFKDGETKLLTFKIAENTIETSSEHHLKDIKDEILRQEYVEKWDKINILKKID